MYRKSWECGGWGEGHARHFRRNLDRLATPGKLAHSWSAIHILLHRPVTHAANQERRTESTRVLFLPPLISPASMGPLTIGKITILRLISTAACLRSAWVKCRLHPAY